MPSLGMRHAVSILALLVTVLAARPRAAHAEGGTQLSLRAGGGPGLGSVGLGGRLGAALEIWAADQIAVGLQASAFTQSNYEIFGRKEKSSGRLLGPVLAWRTQASRSYFVAVLGTGYADVSREIEEPGPIFCWEYCPAQTPAEGSGHYQGYSVDAAVGWLTHPRDSSLELGAVLRVDRTADIDNSLPADYFVTLNFEIGAAAFGVFAGEGAPLERLEL